MTGLEIVGAVALVPVAALVCYFALLGFVYLGFLRHLT